MAFWKKKSEDPWDIDPNRKREPVMFYERDPEPQPEPKPAMKEDEGLAMPETTAEQHARAEQEEPEDAPECPWCGEKMVRAYLLGGRDMICFADQRPHGFWGSLGHEKTYLGDDTGFLGGNYQSCWQCKPCRKLVIDIPEPIPEDSFSRWDGNPVAPPSADEIEE